MPSSTAFAALVLIALAVAPASAQTIGGGTNLSFGSFLAGGGGSVAVSAGGARTQSGGVILVGQGAGTSSAQFTVVGTANATYSITLPPDNTVVLSDGNGNTMTVNSFVSSPPATGTLSGGGNQGVRVGATLIVAPNQAPGTYAGSFNVTVNY
ncbi:MAG: DUF4402 domain-containing protein [Caldimonas sp.]